MKSIRIGLFSFVQNINWVAIGLIFLACLMANFVLRYGLPVNTTTELQMDFISKNEKLWHLAWFSWNLAAISLCVFCAFLYRASQRTMLAKIGLLLVLLGLIPDLSAEYMLSFKLSEYAISNAMPAFIATEALALKLTGLYANGLYNLGGLVLTLVLLKEKFIPNYLAYLGVLGWLLGLCLSLLVVTQDMATSEWLTMLAMVFSLVFMALVNVFCFSKMSP